MQALFGARAQGASQIYIINMYSKSSILSLFQKKPRKNYKFLFFILFYEDFLLEGSPFYSICQQESDSERENNLFFFISNYYVLFRMNI